MVCSWLVPWIWLDTEETLGLRGEHEEGGELEDGWGQTRIYIANYDPLGGPREVHCEGRRSRRRIICEDAVRVRAKWGPGREGGEREGREPGRKAKAQNERRGSKIVGALSQS